MTEKTNKIVVIDGVKNKTIANLWWDGKKVCCDTPSFLEQLRHAEDFHFRQDDKSALDRLLFRYKSGYLHAYKVGK